jgi:cytochrome P450
MTAARTVSTNDVDLFSDEHLENPYPDYQSLRDAGPVVHLSRLDVTALARYKPVREAVDNWETFRSGQGVSLNDLLNKAWTGTVIATDPPYHSALRAGHRQSRVCGGWPAPMPV